MNDHLKAPQRLLVTGGYGYTGNSFFRQATCKPRGPKIVDKEHSHAIADFETEFHGVQAGPCWQHTAAIMQQAKR